MKDHLTLVPEPQDTERKKPNYALRRTVSIAVAGVALYAAIGIGNHIADVVKGPQPVIPSLEEVKVHPDKYAPYTVQPGDTVEGIVKRFEKPNIDSRPDIDAATAQLGGSPDLQPGDILYVPETTVPQHPQTPTTQGN